MWLSGLRVASPASSPLPPSWLSPSSSQSSYLTRASPFDTFSAGKQREGRAAVVRQECVNDVSRGNKEREGAQEVLHTWTRASRVSRSSPKHSERRGSERRGGARDAAARVPRPSPFVPRIPCPLFFLIHNYSCHHNYRRHQRQRLLHSLHS